MTQHLALHPFKLWMLALIFCLGGLDAHATNSNKVLIIDSYGVDYQWSNSIIDGINHKLSASYPGIELNVEYLSSELFSDTSSWKLKMNTILDTYQHHPPIAIVFISDEAWMTYNSVNTTRLGDVPLLLCAVKPHTISIDQYDKQLNTLQLSDFDATTEVMKRHNATGILRQMNISGYVDMMHHILPKMNRIALITDNRFYGVYTRLMFEEEMRTNHPDYPVEYLDARFVSTDSLFKCLPKITPTTGVLLTSWLTEKHGFKYSKDYTYKEISNTLKTPIFITNNIGFEKGYFLGGCFNQADFWGEQITTMLLAVIEGTSPREIAPRAVKDEQCFVDWEVLHKFGLSENNLPEHFLFQSKPESVFEKYQVQILFFVTLFIVLIAAYIYTLRNHLRLQKAQKQTLLAILEATEANKQLEQTSKNLTIALKKAEESDRLKTAFLANISHEIRTPLNAIVGFSQLIASAEDEQEQAELAAIIKRNSDLLLQLISDILDISKIESGMLHVTADQVNLDAVCKHAISMLHTKCCPEVTLSYTAAEQPLTIHTDENRLMQVLVNLIGNAVKFTRKGNIEVGYFSYNDELVEFYVKDSGIGIAPEQICTIFNRFIKLNSCIEGTGLGLAISKTIVEILGGQIGVESKLGEGSRFWFRIKKEMK
ncbi:MAG: HAMP domain-containing sensor histidine kinase [Alistipes sp.]